MITQNEFEKIQAFSKHAHFSSLSYMTYEDLEQAELVLDNEHLKVLYKNDVVQPVIEYAAVNLEVLVDYLQESKLKGALHFVPPIAVAPLQLQGFKVLGEYADFFCNPLGNIRKSTEQTENLPIGYHIEYATPEDDNELAEISQRCIGLSRGFFGETKEWFADWIAENRVIVEREDNCILGFCCVSTYNEGTTLWIRELLVSPEQQRRGIGQKLMTNAFQYGMREGAVKSFLAVDIENVGAIQLYNKFGFERKGDETEIHMIRL